MMQGLRTAPIELVVTVVIGRSYGCSVQAIVHAYGHVLKRQCGEQERLEALFSPI